MSEEALAKLAERALAMALEAPEDEYAGLAPEEMLLRKKPGGLELADRNDPEPQELKDRALIAEEAARDVMGVSNSEVAGADRKSVVEGKSVSVRVDLGGRGLIKKKKTTSSARK